MRTELPSHHGTDCLRLLASTQQGKQNRGKRVSTSNTHQPIRAKGFLERPSTRGPSSTTRTTTPPHDHPIGIDEANPGLRRPVPVGVPRGGASSPHPPPRRGPRAGAPPRRCTSSSRRLSRYLRHPNVTSESNPVPRGSVPGECCPRQQVTACRHPYSFPPSSIFLPCA